MPRNLISFLNCRHKARQASKWPTTNISNPDYFASPKLDNGELRLNIPVKDRTAETPTAPSSTPTPTAPPAERNVYAMIRDNQGVVIPDDGAHYMTIDDNRHNNTNTSIHDNNSGSVSQDLSDSYKNEQQEYKNRNDKYNSDETEVHENVAYISVDNRQQLHH